MLFFIWKYKLLRSSMDSIIILPAVMDSISSSENFTVTCSLTAVMLSIMVKFLDNSHSFTEGYISFKF